MWALIQYGWCPYKGGKLEPRDMHTGRPRCEKEGRDWSDVFISQGTPKIANKPPESRGEAWIRISLTALRSPLLLDF